MFIKGINLHGRKGLTDDEYLREMAARGFGATFTGIREPAHQAAIAESCAKYGILYETIHAPFNHINDIWLEDDRGMLNELLACVDNCVLAGVKTTVVHLSSGENPPPMNDLGFDRFTRLVDYAASKGVMVAFENQRKLANLAWSLETFSADVAGFCWDCGHEACFTPGRHYMPLFGGRLICTHIHDNTGVFDSDNHFLPFDGKLDFTYVTKALRDADYKGVLMLEVANNPIDGSTKSGFYDDLTPEQYLDRAYSAICTLETMILA